MTNVCKATEDMLLIALAHAQYSNDTSVLFEYVSGYPSGRCSDS